MDNEIKPGSWRAWMAAIRPKTFGIAVSPVFVGISIAVSETGMFEPLIALLTLAVCIAIQAMSNMENDVGYTKRKADKSNRRGLPRATSEGWLTAAQVDRAIVAVCVVLVAVSLALAFYGGWIIFVLGALSVVAGYLYMGGPKPIAYTPWGELLVFVFYGLVAVGGSYLLQTGFVSVAALTGGAACGSLGAAVLAVNNRRDAVHDESVGRKTLPVVLGKARFTRLFLYMLLLPFVLVLTLATFEPDRFMYLAGLIPVFKIKGLYNDFRTLEGVDLNRTLFETVKLEVLFSLFLSAGALLDALVNWVL